MSRFRDASMTDIINENAKLGAMLRKARDELSKNKKLVSALRKQLDAVMAEREALENERQRHQAELNNRADASADQSYLHELEEDLRRLEDEREDLKRQLEEAQETESVSPPHADCQRALMNLLQDELRSVRRQLEALEEQQGDVDDLRAELARVEDERDQAVESAEDQGQFRDKIDQLEEDKESLERELRALKTGQDARESEKRDHAEQIKHLEAKIASLEAVREEFEEKAASHEFDLEQVATSWREEVLRRDERIEETEQRMATIEDEMKNIVDELEEKVVQLDAANRDIQAVSCRGSDRGGARLISFRSSLIGLKSWKQISTIDRSSTIALCKSWLAQIKISSSAKQSTRCECRSRRRWRQKSMHCATRKPRRPRSGTNTERSSKICPVKWLSWRPNVDTRMRLGTSSELKAGSTATRSRRCNATW